MKDTLTPERLARMKEKLEKYAANEIHEVMFSVSKASQLVALAEKGLRLIDLLRESLPLIEIVRDYEPGEPTGACPPNRARMVHDCITDELAGNARSASDFSHG
jgi:hypothetical protein